MNKILLVHYCSPFIRILIFSQVILKYTIITSWSQSRSLFLTWSGSPKFSNQKQGLHIPGIKILSLLRRAVLNILFGILFGANTVVG